MRAVPHAAAELERIRRLRPLLLRWYRRNRRDLPWRRTRDPYAVWVSEVMLQQTQVATVIPYYRRFMERFPDPFALAEASEEAVLSSWSGLGYYGRARSLRAAARKVVERFGGRIPADPDALLSLPGVGRYTAGAIASIAFGLEEPVLDGNVRRVLCRLTARPVARDPEIWDLARSLVRGRDPGDLNQSLMEVGATVCAPRSPRCPVCPVRRGCAALAEGRPVDFPRPTAAGSTSTVRVWVAVLRRNGRVLLERACPDSPFRGTWDLPGRVIAGDGDPRREIAAGLRDRHDLTVDVGRKIASAAHSIMRLRLRLEAYDCRLRRGRASRKPELRWVRPDRIAETPVSGVTRKVLRLSEDG